MFKGYLESKLLLHFTNNPVFFVQRPFWFYLCWFFQRFWPVPMKGTMPMGLPDTFFPYWRHSSLYVEQKSGYNGFLFASCVSYIEETFLCWSFWVLTIPASGFRALTWNFHMQLSWWLKEKLLKIGGKRLSPNICITFLNPYMLWAAKYQT